MPQSFASFVQGIQGRDRAGSISLSARILIIALLRNMWRAVGCAPCIDLDTDVPTYC